MAQVSLCDNLVLTSQRVPLAAPKAAGAVPRALAGSRQGLTFQIRMRRKLPRASAVQPSNSADSAGGRRKAQASKVRRNVEVEQFEVETTKSHRIHGLRYTRIRRAASTHSRLASPAVGLGCTTLQPSMAFRDAAVALLLLVDSFGRESATLLPR